MTAHTDLDAREALAERLVDDTTRALEILIVSLGLDLGLYQALADLGPATELEIATATGVAPRYAREWLEQQATAGYVACPDPAQPPEQRRYQLPPGHAEVLLDTYSPCHTAPLAIILAGVARVLPQLLAAYRSGGVPYAAYGPAMRQGIAALNRPMFLHELASTWLPAVPDLEQRLRSAPPARVLDLGCGLGASSIALAHAHPRTQVLASTSTRRRSHARLRSHGVAYLRISASIWSAPDGSRRIAWMIKQGRQIDEPDRMARQLQRRLVISHKRATGAEVPPPSRWSLVAGVRLVVGWPRMRRSA